MSRSSITSFPLEGSALCSNSIPSICLLKSEFHNRKLTSSRKCLNKSILSSSICSRRGSSNLNFLTKTRLSLSSLFESFMLNNAWDCAGS
uniref:Uncharacterized protein n=1 Tax=Arundo donax TaxID=35708 RepID=A0A0A9CZD6_ARUDO